MSASDGAETPTPVPAPEVGTVAADATIEPARWSELRFETEGIVAEVLTEAGESVDAGDIVARLDPTEAELGAQEAEFALASARATLARLRARPRVEEVAAAEADLADAEAELERADAQRAEVTGGSTEADIALAQAEVTAAEVEWLRAREDRDELYRRTDEDDEDDRKERALADYAFHAAEVALASAQATLDARRNTADERVREADARVASATAQRDVALAELALLTAGSPLWEVAAAEADVAEAAVAVKDAEAVLARAVLRAPFAGTVTRVDVEVGELVEPGQTIAMLATVSRLEALTVDLTELDVVRVREGQVAMVTADAMPDAKLQGQVARIGLRSVDYRGDVTYPITVELDEVPAELRWGMTAFVEIDLD